MDSANSEFTAVKSNAMDSANCEFTAVKITLWTVQTVSLLRRELRSPEKILIDAIHNNYLYMAFNFSYKNHR